MDSVKRVIVALAAVSLTCAGAAAKVTPSAWVSAGMVLQRGQEVRLTGLADAGEAVVASFVGVAPLSADGKRVKGEFAAVAGGDGRWSVALPPMRAGGPYVLSVGGVEVSDVMVGDVYLCSGQSNMELPVGRVMDKYAMELKGTVNNKVRMLHVGLETSYDGAASDVKTDGWKPLDFDNAQGFSALAYFFAREMQAASGVAVGVVEAAVGGSPIEAWMSRKALEDGGFGMAVSQLDVNSSADYRRAVEDYGKTAGDRWEATLAAAEGVLAQDWTAAAYDDSGWETVDAVGGSWGADSTRALNGAHWFRKSFTLSASQAVLPATLRLGALVDADEAWVNGVKVGQTYYQYPPRIYDIPDGVLREGRNVVAVRLVSQNGVPQFIGDKYRGVFLGGNKWLCGRNVAQVDFDNVWSHRYAVAMPPKGGIPFFYYTPTVLYNAMVAPLEGIGLAGVVWYQGESNVGREGEYRGLLRGMMADWRRTFRQADLDFVIVGLADFEKPVTPWWRALQAVQREVAEADPHAGFAKAEDLGEWNDVHPLDKKGVAIRVAAQMKTLRKAKGNK